MITLSSKGQRLDRVNQMMLHKYIQAAATHKLPIEIMCTFDSLTEERVPRNQFYTGISRTCFENSQNPGEKLCWCKRTKCTYNMRFFSQAPQHE